MDIPEEDLGMFTFGPGEWIFIIFLIVLLIFGPSKLPQMGSAMGKAIKEFKKAGKELRSGVSLDEDEEEDKDSKSK
jgi:sec-independent protein translocase protein TatA